MKRIALINDLSGFGKCSLTAAIPVISVMGIQACPLPTAILSAQTGFNDYYCDDYTDRMDEFIRQWKKMEVSFEGIHSGYLAGADQIDKVLLFLEEFKKEDTLYLADPVLGDDGKLFKNFTSQLLEEMKRLAKKAQVITPNLTELCFLADVDYFQLIQYGQKDDYLKRVETVGKKLLERAEGQQQIVVTGIIREKNGQEMVGNLVVSEGESFFLETAYTGKSFSGTGDLFSAVVCGSMVKGLSAGEAVEKAVYFLKDAIEEASGENIPAPHGVCFENYLSLLLEGD